MSKIEVELDDLKLDDDGNPVTDSLPEPLQKLFNTAFGKGKERAAQDAKRQLEDLRREVASGRNTDPLAEEKIKALEIELSKHREADRLREQRYDEALKEVEQRQEAELAERDKRLTEAQEQLNSRTARIRALAVQQIGRAAIEAGARAESVAELEAILGSRIALDEHLEAFVTDPDDPAKPWEREVEEDGKKTSKRVTIQGLVSDYLADHPHHRGTSKGRTMGSRGGSSLAGQRSGVRTAVQEAEERMAEEPTKANVSGSLAAKLREAR